MLLPRKLLGLIYVVIGIFVASSKDYLDNLETVKRVLSALLAIRLGPCSRTVPSARPCCSGTARRTC